MKRLITVLLVVFMLALSVRVVLAGGDKVRGEEGLGDVIQNQECLYDTDKVCFNGDYVPTITE